MVLGLGVFLLLSLPSVLITPIFYLLVILLPNANLHQLVCFSFFSRLLQCMKLVLQ